MFQTIFSRTIWFVVLFLLQVLVFNHVHIFGYATPMPYVYFLLILPSNTPHWLYVLLGFLMGLLIDLFTNTPGMAAGSMTLVGLIAPWLLAAVSPSEHDDDTLEPSCKSLEWGGFLRFTVFAVITHCVMFFMARSLLLLRLAGTPHQYHRKQRTHHALHCGHGIGAATRMTLIYCRHTIKPAPLSSPQTRDALTCIRPHHTF